MRPAEPLARLGRIADEQIDLGRAHECRVLAHLRLPILDANARELKSGAARYKSKTLEKLANEYSQDSDNIDGENWNRQRKVLQRRNQVSPYQYETNNF